MFSILFRSKTVTVLFGKSFHEFQTIIQSCAGSLAVRLNPHHFIFYHWSNFLVFYILFNPFASWNIQLMTFFSIFFFLQPINVLRKCTSYNRMIISWFLHSIVLVICLSNLLTCEIPVIHHWMKLGYLFALAWRISSCPLHIPRNLPSATCSACFLSYY